jgi:holliday junction DNA helicase RuvA
MIGRLSGVLLEKNPPQMMLEVQGVGYEIDVPMSTFYNLPNVGERVTLFTHLIVREDAHLLYGFATAAERRAFRQLLKISGVAVNRAAPVSGDVLNALLSLGYNEKEALHALKQLPEGLNVSDGIRHALKSLARG